MDSLKYDIDEIIIHEELFRAFAGSTVLVTGATGLIGSLLVKSLYYANFKYQLDINIIGFIRNKEKAIIVFDELYDKLNFVFDSDIACDYIIHTISPTASRFFIEHPVETIKASVESTIKTLDIAKKYKASVLYLSSMEQYGVTLLDKQEVKEDDIGVIDHLNVRSSYSEAKRLCECLCISYANEYDLNVKIARLAQTFGAGASLSDNRMPMQFAKAVVEHKDIELHTEGNSISNFVYTTDAIIGLLYILLFGTSGQAYNVCNDSESRSVREIAELVSSNVANGSIKVVTKIQNNMGYAPEVRMYLNSDKLKGLGWNASVDLCEAYKRLVKYLEQNNYI